MATTLPKLSADEVQQRLTQLSGWQLDGKMITKEYLRAGFTDAARFISQIAPLADGLNHHPDVLLHKYKRVKVMLWTHSHDGLTQNDFELAAKIDKLPPG